MRVLRFRDSGQDSVDIEGVVTTGGSAPPLVVTTIPATMPLPDESIPLPGTSPIGASRWQLDPDGSLWLLAPSVATGPVKLYDFTITGADQASIDTNVDGVYAGTLSGAYDVLEVWVIARTDDAAAQTTFSMILNNDSGANYDTQAFNAHNATLVGGTGLAATGWVFNTHGSGGTAGYPGLVRMTIPGYAGTNFNKIAEVSAGEPDGTAANNLYEADLMGWRSTTAIDRLKVFAAGTAKLKVGSRLMVFAR